jgi:hypothetical protein
METGAGGLIKLERCEFNEDDGIVAINGHGPRDAIKYWATTPFANLEVSHATIPYLMALSGRQTAPMYDLHYRLVSSLRGVGRCTP